IRQSAIGCLMYTNDNHGTLPERYDTKSSPPVTRECYQIIENGKHYSAALLCNMVSSGGATTMVTKYISDPRVFYCPAFATRDFDFDAFNKPWSIGNAGGTNGNWRIGYLYNPHYKRKVLPTLQYTNAYPKLQN